MVGTKETVTITDPYCDSQAASGAGKSLLVSLDQLHNSIGLPGT
jgi:hypothetical protein